MNKEVKVEVLRCNNSPSDFETKLASYYNLFDVISVETHTNVINARNFGDIIVYIAIITYTEKHKLEYISELNLSHRTFNSLRRCGYITIDQVIELLRSKAYTKISNFGPVCIKEIKDRLAELNIYKED